MSDVSLPSDAILSLSPVSFPVSLSLPLPISFISSFLLSDQIGWKESAVNNKYMAKAGKLGTNQF